ncbi:alpha-glucan family phosphorylase [Telluribacter sp. SYSU D00476]|uniref:alpha-glucan family phosphorylase n=1 Tax=Telluribacter sp. SYSU D00476 TaxID=2811430 RepID=UPI001FF57D16|nr:alpha-glucan family phosphorylase [Telluribacter sp. SYSU D00476]
MTNYSLPYIPDPKYTTRVAYLSMEYAIHQPLKIYAGGLGYLAGSHLRSAAHLLQNTIGIGILWKYGYYDQTRQQDQHMGATFVEKHYEFLEPTHIKFQITVHQAPVMVTAYYLDPRYFGTAPLFLLSTDLPENDYLARTITHRLYDANPETKLAQQMLLGTGGVKLLDELGLTPEVYHLNESHALSAAFALYEKYHDWEVVRRKMVFTNHTPEEAGNQKTDLRLLDRMSFFGQVTVEEALRATQQAGQVFDHTLAAFRLSSIANGVSRMHTETVKRTYSQHGGLCPTIAITNAQDQHYWADKDLYRHTHQHDLAALLEHKQAMKQPMLEEVADQTGKIFSPRVLTMVWARRFAGYKRPELLLHDMDRFQRLLSNKQFPIQIIWSGKPYPTDYTAIGTFDLIVETCKQYPNCAILTGYELRLSKELKQGADVWLNTPRVTREASGTSGMTAAMNGAINLSTLDGWFPEFVRDGINGFVIPPVDYQKPHFEQDAADAAQLYDLLENKVLPMYYQEPGRWAAMMRSSMDDILPYFDSERMVAEYYDRMYHQEVRSPVAKQYSS